MNPKKVEHVETTDVIMGWARAGLNLGNGADEHCRKS